MERYKEIKVKLKLSSDELHSLMMIMKRSSIMSGSKLQKCAVAEFVISQHIKISRKIVQRKQQYSLTWTATEAYMFRLFTQDLITQDIWEQNVILRILMEIDRKSA